MMAEGSGEVKREAGARDFHRNHAPGNELARHASTRSPRLDALPVLRRASPSRAF